MSLIGISLSRWVTAEECRVKKSRSACSWRWGCWLKLCLRLFLPNFFIFVLRDDRLGVSADLVWIPSPFTPTLSGVCVSKVFINDSVLLSSFELELCLLMISRTTDTCKAELCWFLPTNAVENADALDESKRDRAAFFIVFYDEEKFEYGTESDRFELSVL